MLFKSQPKLVNIILNQRKNKSQKFLNKALLKVVSFYCICISQLVIKKKKKKKKKTLFFSVLLIPGTHPQGHDSPNHRSSKKISGSKGLSGLVFVPQPQHDDSYRVGV